jgi:Hypothetical glycosyl hydrolase family 15
VRRAGWGAVLALAVAGIAAVLLGSPSPTTPRRPAAFGTVRLFLQRLDEAKVQATTPAQWATIARDNVVVVLNSWDFRLIPILKRANPRVQIWVYKDLSGVRSDDCRTGNGNCGSCLRGITDRNFLSSGMGYCWVERHHPNWLLKAAGSGQSFQFRGYQQTWETDYGNRAYRRQWTANVLADVRAHGWDGVKLDNALTTADAYGVAAKYPTDTAVQAATYSALRYIGHALHQVGVASIANVGYATKFPGLWQRWLGPVDGLEQEFYLSSSTQPDAFGAAWEEYENEVSSCAAQHKLCWFHAGDYSPTVTPQTRLYALASFLLATDGRQLLSVGDFMPPGPAPNMALGHSLGIVNELGGTWRRSFTGGVAVVNPTRSSTLVYLGDNYLGDAGRRVSAVSLQPTSGAVLRATTRRDTPSGNP